MKLHDCFIIYFKRKSESDENYISDFIAYRTYQEAVDRLVQYVLTSPHLDFIISRVVPAKRLKRNKLKKLGVEQRIITL